MSTRPRASGVLPDRIRWRFPIIENRVYINSLACLAGGDCARAEPALRRRLASLSTLQSPGRVGNTVPPPYAHSARRQTTEVML